MNKFKFLGVAFLASVSVAQAQDINQAKKAIDAEQFESAKSTLKSIIKTNPAEGAAFFLLGNVYLEQNIADSAKMVYQKGLSAKEHAQLNNIGLGQIDLDNGDLMAAKAKFELAKKEMKKKDFEEYVYIARAYMNASKPDYKAAIATLNLAKERSGQEAQVQLAFGDAFYGEKNQNEAYAAYRNAFQANNSLIRAKMQLGVLLKGAKAYTEAVAAYNDVIAISPNYGPVYRELAETYYYWAANVPGRYDQYIKEALTYYEKYMALTDYSLASRMRHADFLILAKDYKALEVEANKMKEIDAVNPRIYRYLGYAAYENGNVDLAIKSLNDFIGIPTNKVIAQDYLYLGLAKIKKGTSADGATIDATLFNEGIGFIKKAVEMEAYVANDLNEISTKLYGQKLYKEAAAILEIAVTNPDSKNYLIDNFYLGTSIYFANANLASEKQDQVALQKADTALGNLIAGSPTTHDAYLYRARVNSLLGKPEMMIQYYEEFAKVVTESGADELAKSSTKAKLVEAYNTIAANSASAKAKEYFAKTLAIDPANKFATESLKSLK
ncbi:tetratricopeptide repeat protein [Flavobacterium sp. W1B]|uniref:tetratricopeptide repeat protein n=1 Tax=Flavobacterium sp. W1B TaxID=3394146 RepID=UPI0039BD5BB0